MSKRKRGEGSWNGESTLWVEVMSDVGVSRKLEDICQSLTLLAEQGEVVQFLTNTERVQKINGLVENIQEALMDYQACILN